MSEIDPKTLYALFSKAEELIYSCDEKGFKEWFDELSDEEQTQLSDLTTLLSDKTRRSIKRTERQIESRMKREEILYMEAGREMDLLVAETVMGMIVPRDENGNQTRSWEDGYTYEGTFYSTDIAAAWKVFEKFEDAEIHKRSRGDYTCFGDGNLNAAETVEVAICRVALFCAMDR
jgi:hypothetical protein